MKKPILLSILFVFAATAVANAASDPWVGEWVNEGKTPSAPGKSLKIEPLDSGGYSFQMKRDFTATVPIVPDGRPHKGEGVMSQATFTCKRADALTIACDVMISGSSSIAKFALSADGKNLTETSISQEVTVRYHSETEVEGNVSADIHANGQASSSQSVRTTQKNNAPQRTTTEHTDVVVYHRK